MDINIFLKRLTDKTKASSCKWESLSDSRKRLILENGSVVIQQEPDSIWNSAFSVFLYDREGIFARYTETPSDSMNFNQELYTLMEGLYNSILAEEQKVVVRKIQTLFDDLK